jgi:hypothetical protein
LEKSGVKRYPTGSSAPSSAEKRKLVFTLFKKQNDLSGNKIPIHHPTLLPTNGGAVLPVIGNAVKNLSKAEFGAANLSIAPQKRISLNLSNGTNTGTTLENAAGVFWGRGKRVRRIRMLKHTVKQVSSLRGQKYQLVMAKGTTKDGGCLRPKKYHIRGIFFDVRTHLPFELVIRHKTHPNFTLPP